MTTIIVDVLHYQHWCPGNLEPHVWDTHRTVVSVTPGGPCQTPITIGTGNNTSTINCDRRLPRDRQCPACRTAVINRHVTTLPPTNTASDSAPGIPACSVCTTPGVEALTLAGNGPDHWHTDAQ